MKSAEEMNQMTLATEREGGEPETPQIQQVEINKRAAASSQEELVFYREAIDQAHTSQTHFADLGASFRYRCPISSRAANSEDFPQSVRMHFTLYALYFSVRTQFRYHIRINNEESSLPITNPS